MQLFDKIWKGGGFRLFENKFSSSEFELFKTEIFERK